MDEGAASTPSQEQMPERSRFGLGNSTIVFVAAAVAIAFVLGVVAMAVTRTQDPFAADSVHVATLTRPQAECEYWYASVAGDSNHKWRNQVNVPAAWTSPVEGELRVTDDMRAEFTFDGVTITMGGGNMSGNPPTVFTADCPSTLNR